MFKRVLVANRGEIAVRIIRTLRDLNIESVALYSDSDRDSLHISLADYAIRLPGENSLETYLNMPLVIESIIESGADAIHPGYGFLSENAEFSKQVSEKTKAKFIGASPESIVLMGDKIGARQHMITHNIPIVPGVEKPLSNLSELNQVAKKIGYPLLLKASGGGGGRGMRVVQNKSQLKESYDSCKRESENAFANPDIFCERYLENPRHIEFQVLCDQKGNAVHLFERECSIQRRYQKLFEEAPSSFLNSEQRDRFGQIAIDVARSCNYEGLGTVEFIAEDPDTLYFMEMNTRVQVEHPVTEWITGKDLVAEQIKVASGLPLSFEQRDLHINGWAMEARINAEDPAMSFMPASGRVKRLHWPSGPYVRVDSHIYLGYQIPSYFDSLLAKLIVWGQNRDEAIARMKRSLNELVIEGVSHTGFFHEFLLNNKAFLDGLFTTAFIEENQKVLEHYYRGDEGIIGYDEEEKLATIASSAVIIREKSRVLSELIGNNDTSHWIRQARKDFIHE